jgi:hypothetical protein
MDFFCGWNFAGDETLFTKQINIFNILFPLCFKYIEI